MINIGDLVCFVGLEINEPKKIGIVIDIEKEPGMYKLNWYKYKIHWICDKNGNLFNENWIAWYNGSVVCRLK